MKRLEDYSNEELKALYKRFGVYAVTMHFSKYAKDFKRPLIRSFVWTGNYHDNPFRQRAFCSMQIETNKLKIDRLMESSGNKDDIMLLIYENEYLNIMRRCLLWFCNGYEMDDVKGMVEYDKDTSFNKVAEFTDHAANPEESLDTLFMNDEDNFNNGIATDLQMLDFVWDTLQWCSQEDFKKLLSFADKGLVSDWENTEFNKRRYAKKPKPIIRQADVETGDYVAEYATRQECIEKTGIKKSYLCQCLDSARANKYSCATWKKWKGQDGRKYYFIDFRF